MKAMILAAGRGERLRPYTDTLPKVLLPLHQKPIIVHIIEQLKKAKIEEIVINLAHLGDKIQETLGTGEEFGVRIEYSQEPIGGYETAGGVACALPLLGNEPFVLVNGDICTDFDFATLKLPTEKEAHLILVENPVHNLEGDFHFDGKCLSLTGNAPRYTYSGIGIYHPKLFQQVPVARYRLRTVLEAAINDQKASAAISSGQWMNLDTPERLALANEKF